MLRACIALITLGALFAHADALPIFVSDCSYSYSPTSPLGPDNWVCPDANGTDTWECVGDSGQSPIDLPANIDSISAEFDYIGVQKERFIFGSVNATVDFLQTGGVSFDPPVLGPGIDPNFVSFEGLYIRIPSEHFIGGEQADLEVQLVYQNSNDTGYSRYTIVAFLAALGDGDSQGMSNLNASIWRALNTSDFTADLAGFNDGQSFWRYDGSFTSPPCHTAHWLVSATVLRVSQETFNYFGSFQAGTVPVATSPRPTQAIGSRSLSLVDPATSQAKGGNWKVAVGISSGVLGLIFIILIIGAVVFRS